MGKTSSIFKIATPTLSWVEGHVLGNGDLGGVVWGGPEEFHLGLSKHDVNFYGETLTRQGWEAPYPELVRRVAAGDRDFLTRYGYGVGAQNGPFPLSCGQLSLKVFRDEYFPQFIQRLDWRKAECRIVCSMPPGRVAAGRPVPPPILLKIRILAGCNVAEIELACVELSKVELRYSAGAADAPLLAPAVFESNRMVRNLPEGDSFAVELDGAELSAGPLGLAGAAVFGGAAGALTLRLAVASNYDGPPRETAQRNLHQDFSAQARNHEEFWRNYWRRSEVSLQNQELESLWRFGVYALGCATAPRTSPPHLQGIWNQYRQPAWHSDYHFNVNIQQTLWGCFTANHPEAAEALVRCVLFDWRKELRANAAQAGLPGLMFPLCADGRGRALSWTVLGMAMGMTAWMSLPLHDFLEHTGKWKEEIADFLRECCLFQLAALQRGEDGRYHVMLSDSPEQVEFRPDGSAHHVLGCDPALDLAAARLLFKHYLELAPEDDPLRGQVAAALADLAELPLKDGVLLEYKTGYFEHGDRPGRFPWSHRHASRLFPLYPGGLYATFCDRETGRRSFREFRSYGAADFSSWSRAWQAIIAARLGLAATARRILSGIVRGFRFRGGLISHNRLLPQARSLPIFQFEVTGGAVAAVNELLLQRSPEGIRLFPGIPGKEDAAFQHFCIGNGIFVSARKRGRRLISLKIKFDHAGTVKLLRVMNFNGGTVTGEAGSSFDLSPSLK